MLSFLSSADVDRLLKDASTETRLDVAGKLAQELDSPALTDAELAMAQDLLRTMARDVEVAVRSALASSLRAAHRVPHDVALRLANDVESVALPILAESTAITDDDLIRILRGGFPAKQEAIGSRRDVSEAVSDVLIAEGREAAVAALMRNQTARISDQGLSRAVDRFAASDAVKEGLVKRHYLPASVAERLVAMVSEQLREYLVAHHELSPSVATDVVLQSREQATMKLSHGSTEEELRVLVEQMHRNKRLTPSLVLRMLCMGELAFVEVAMAELAEVPIPNARILIHDAGPHGLASLFAKTGLPANLLPIIRVAIDVLHEAGFDGGKHDLERFRARVLMRVMTQVDDFGEEDLNYLLGKLGDVLGRAA